MDLLIFGIKIYLVKDCQVTKGAKSWIIQYHFNQDGERLKHTFTSQTDTI